MGKIVGIGGGRMGELETFTIDEEIVALSGKTRPKALFVPTASSDSPERWEVFQKVYGGRLGCDADILLLLGSRPFPDLIVEKIAAADIIYVGGGNTLKMMRRWRLLGVDKLLEDAFRAGTILAGSSAGCICWFDSGHSDSMSFYNPDDWKYIRVKGMGLLDAMVCPHYDGDTAGVKREADFKGMASKHLGTAIGIDNFCAIEVVDDSYRIITSRPGAWAYRLARLRGEIVDEPIEPSTTYAPLAELLG